MILFFGQCLPCCIIAEINIYVNFFFNLFNKKKQFYVSNELNSLTPDILIPTVFFAGVYLFWLFVYIMKNDALLLTFVIIINDFFLILELIFQIR